MIKKIFVNIHPFLFALVSLLFIYFQAMLSTPPYEIIRPFLIFSLLILALYPLAIKLAGGWEWGGILMTILVLGLFFQPTHFLVTGMLAGLVVFLQFAYRRLIRRRFCIAQVSLSLTLIAFFIVIVQAIMLFSAFRTVPFSYYKAMAARSETDTIPLSVSDSSLKPDIYYIILDSYSRADVLQENFHYDNSEFIKYLEEKGFVVPKNARSNYARTAVSISSALDMQYWDTISPDMQDVAFWWPVKPVIQYSRVRRSLEAIGYKSVAFASDFGIADNQTVDMYLKIYPVRLTDYENQIAVTTPLKPLFSPLQEVMPVMSNDAHRRYVLDTFDKLKTIPHIEGPKFIFAHIISPHAPFVFDAKGTPIDPERGFTFAPYWLSREQRRQGHINQIQFLNGQLKSAIEAILKESKNPPIIIFQADHGYGLRVYPASPATPDCYKERFSIFGAYYLPGKPRETIPDDLTPVNLFRIILNEYFGAGMPLLENHNYLTFGNNMFAGMQDVTNRIEQACIYADD